MTRLLATSRLASRLTRDKMSKPPFTSTRQPQTNPVQPAAAREEPVVQASISESDVESAAKKTRATQITKEGKDELWAYFDKKNWARNTPMPRANVDTALDGIINKFKLQRDQASRQLLKWKAAKYQNTQVCILLNPGDIEKSISESISMSPEAFMTKFLHDINHGRDVVTGSTDLSLF